MRVPSCYIVRIYRQGFRTLYGVVEDAQSGGVWAFRSAEACFCAGRFQVPERLNVTANPGQLNNGGLL